MSMHMIAYQQTGGFATGALVSVPSIVDPATASSGGGYLVPPKYNKVLYAACADVGGNVTRAQLQSPSLREVFFPDITPINLAGPFDLAKIYDDKSDSPMQLQTAEVLNFFIQTSVAGDSVTGLVILADDVQPDVKGKIYSIQATSTPTLVAGTWVNGPLTFNQPLPAGDYDIVGWRVSAAGLVAARLVFLGQSAVTRPGVLAQSTVGVAGDALFRNGYAGLFGTFNNVTPPSVDHIGAAGAITAFHTFDLIPH
jgi:hypothetical protein